MILRIFYVVHNHHRQFKCQCIFKRADIQSEFSLQLLKAVHQSISVYIKLSGSLGEIQVIFKEGTDGDQGFFVNRIQSFLFEDLVDKHFTYGNRKLVDQSADSKLVISEYIFICVENLAYFKGCMCFLVCV